MNQGSDKIHISPSKISYYNYSYTAWQVVASMQFSACSVEQHKNERNRLNSQNRLSNGKHRNTKLIALHGWGLPPKTEFEDDKRVQSCHQRRLAGVEQQIWHKYKSRCEVFATESIKAVTHSKDFDTIVWIYKWFFFDELVCFDVEE